MNMKDDRFLLLVEKMHDVLQESGFPSKFRKADMAFVCKEKEFTHAIFLISRFERDFFSISVRCAVRIELVEQVKLKIGGIYTGQNRWTFGIDLWEIESEMQSIPDVPFAYDKLGRFFIRFRDLVAHEREYGAREVDFFVSDDTNIFDKKCEMVMKRSTSYGLPFLSEYGNINSVYKLCERTDRIAELCFIDPNKPVVGIIAASIADRNDIIEKIHSNALQLYGKYKENGNATILEKYLVCVDRMKDIGVFPT